MALRAFDDAQIAGLLDIVRADARRLGSAPEAVPAAEAPAAADVSAAADLPGLPEAPDVFEATDAALPSAAVSNDDLFAAAVWTTLVEPGDATGGILRRVLGPAGALTALDGSDDAILARLDAVGVFTITPDDLAAARGRWAPRLTEPRIRAALRASAVLGVQLIVPGERLWPRGLDDLAPHEPAGLWVRGDVTALTARPAVALVGCRAASHYGEQIAAELADGLTTRGFSIVSGGAYGIDGMAHRAALASEGLTVAIMAGGVDRFYPTGHHDLLGRVVENGAVVSEVACGFPPTRWRFLQRNRLIAAMTLGTVVVEAGHRSGALNTATHARSLDRPVGAVPGPVTSPSSAGCHRLIRDFQSTCVTRAEDVVEMVDPQLFRLDEGGSSGPSEPTRPGDELTPHQVRVLDSLRPRRGTAEEAVAQASGLSAATVRSTLAVLELEGLATERADGWVRRATVGGERG